MNVEGKGRWFKNRAEAEAFLRTVVGAGTRNFDVGCFQINYRWHGTAFDTVNSMFEPLENALYAARFLQRLFKEKGNWEDAAAAYHSRTPKFASRYKSRFQSILAGLDIPPSSGKSVRQTQAINVARPNLYPLLTQKKVQGRSFGSLVPITAVSRRPFLALGG